MSRERQQVVVTDASVLINFAWIGRFDLFGALEEYDFWVPAGVAREVLRPEQADALEAAFARGDLRQAGLTLTEADAFIEVWRRNRYLVDFQSFRELMEQDSGGDRVAEEVVAVRSFDREVMPEFHAGRIRQLRRIGRLG